MTFARSDEREEDERAARRVAGPYDLGGIVGREGSSVNREHVLDR